MGVYNSCTSISFFVPPTLWNKRYQPRVKNFSGHTGKTLRSTNCATSYIKTKKKKKKTRLNNALLKRGLIHLPKVSTHICQSRQWILWIVRCLV